MPKKVLVTGGSGFIGRRTVEGLINQGYEPLIFDHHRREREYYPSNVGIFLGDVRDDVAVTEAMAHVDGWIHLAAVLGTQETVHNPRPAAQSNLMGGLNMLEAAAQYNLPGVYICVGNHWMNNTYSITKSMIERFVYMFNKERGTRINMVRAMNAYGPGQLASPPFGEGKVRKITPAFVCRALCGMPVEVYGDGRQISDMVYVEDVARALVRSLEAACRDIVFERPVEIGPEEHHTVHEVAQLVIDLAVEHGFPRVQIINLPMRPGENMGDRVTADVSSLPSIGMRPEDLLTLEEGMRRTVQSFIESEGQAWRRPEDIVALERRMTLTPYVDT